MKRNILTIALLAASMTVLAACGSTSAQPAESTTAASQAPAASGVRQFSEGIERAESVCPYDGGILISNFGGSDGGYVLYRKNGATETLIAPGKGLNSPTGMAVGNGILFVCDGDALKVFELSDPGRGFQEIHIAGSGHLFNDVAVNGNDLYISVTDEDAIYRMDIASSEKLAEAEPVRWAEVPGPNGITAGNNALYIASIPKDFTSVTGEAVLYRIPDLSSPKAEVLLNVPGLYDGVALSDDGKTLYYSDWNTTSVGALDLQSGETKTIYQEKGIGPADIAWQNGTLYVPDLPGSRILEFTVEETTETANTTETAKITETAKTTGEAKEEAAMTMQEMQDRMEIRELTDVFANLADTKEVEKQVELFLPDGKLEFQIGFDGEINEIIGREALLQAFSRTVGPAKNVYHLNGQQTLTSYSGDEAEGIAYCQATLVNEVDGKDVTTTNYVRYTDHYAKVDGKWYIKQRRTTFLFMETR